MSKGAWIAVLAIGLALGQPSVGHAQSPTPETLPQPEQTIEGVAVPDDESGDASDNEGRQEIERAAKGTIPEAAPVPVDYPNEAVQGDPRAAPAAKECDDACERDKADLQAQKDMANAAWAMLWIALASVILTAIGVGLLAATLSETRNAGRSAAAILGHTKRQADAAEQSFSFNRDSTQRLERPYLFVEIGNQNRLANPGPGMPFLEYQITNFGNTPAIFKSIFIELRPISEIGYLENGRPRRGLERKRWYEVLGPGKSTGTRSIIVLGSGNKERIGPENPLALHGSIEYEDPTGAEHEYHFILSREGGRFCMTYSRHDSEYPKTAKPDA